MVGLGNPGLQYAQQRHNVGFMVLDELAKRSGVGFLPKPKSYLAETRLGIHKLLLQKPQTFMNLSGTAVLPLMQFYKLEPSQLIVVQDDLDLPFGRLRVRAGGSSGGQRGVASIAALLGVEHFVRLKIGISRPPQDWSVENWVLSNFAAHEQPMLAQILAVAADALGCITEFGLQEAQNRYNRTDLRPKLESVVEQNPLESRTIEP